MHDAPLSFCDPTNCGLELPTEEEFGVCPFPLLLHVVPERGREELLTQAQGFFDHHTMLAILP